MNGWMGIGAAAITASAAAVGGFAAVQQFLLPARLRQLEAWARSAKESETDPARAAVLDRIATRATARLVALVHVPNYYLAEWVLWTGWGGWLMAGWATGGPKWSSTPAFVLLPLVVLATSARKGIRVTRERLRIAREFRAGAASIATPRLDMLNQMEGGTRSEFAGGIAYAIAIAAISIGAGLLLSRSAWGVPVVIVGGFALAATIQWIRKQDRDALL